MLRYLFPKLLEDEDSRNSVSTEGCQKNVSRPKGEHKAIPLFLKRARRDTMQSDLPKTTTVYSNFFKNLLFNFY